jgi:hypothetical protein
LLKLVSLGESEILQIVAIPLRDKSLFSIFGKREKGQWAKFRHCLFSNPVAEN